MIAARGEWRYGLLGLPLAFVALPLYLQLPNHYALEFGVPIAALGAVLLLARLFDALLDPWIGALTERLYARSPQAVLGAGVAASAFLVLGFALLFFPPVQGTSALLAWAALSLLITYAAYSVLSVSHQSWGAKLGGNETERGRIVAWREGLGLAGVLLASVLPTLAGWTATTALLAGALAAACWAWATGRRPLPQAGAVARAAWWMPFCHGPFRSLLGVFLVNGIATAIPATLLLFFVQDRLQAPRAFEPLFLATYFLCAAASMPLWLRVVQRIGLARGWLAGMALSVAVFIGASLLGADDTTPFLVICALSGFALGADLALPGAILAGVVADAGERGRGEGLFFGWWNFATKLNLAIAAGVALPALTLAGYVPGARSPEALRALTLAYCLLPCLLKAGAAALLYFTLIRPKGPR